MGTNQTNKNRDTTKRRTRSWRLLIYGAIAWRNTVPGVGTRAGAANVTKTRAQKKQTNGANKQTHQVQKKEKHKKQQTKTRSTRRQHNRNTNVYENYEDS